MTSGSSISMTADSATGSTTLPSRYGKCDGETTTSSSVRRSSTAIPSIGHCHPEALLISLTSSPAFRAGDSSYSRLVGGEQLRFAVHGPGIPDASPRSHGVSRRDVLGRVHVSVAGVSAGGAPEDGLTLTRVPSTCPHAEQRWLVYAGLIFRGGEAAFPPPPESQGSHVAILMTSSLPARSHLDCGLPAPRRSTPPSGPTFPRCWGTSATRWTPFSQTRRQARVIETGHDLADPPG